jgi:ADP-heptose:LPS heptosyltransferase
MRNQLLRDCDWASMAQSLEVRVPFVDLEVLRRITPLFAGSAPVSKRDLAATPRIPLPDAVTSRPKTGFSIPTRTWIQESLPEKESSLRGWSKQIHARFADQAATSHTRYHRPTIVVFRVGQLGDTLISMPAIAAIRRRFPFHRMILLTDRHEGKSGFVSSWDVLGPTGWFDDVVYYQPSHTLVGMSRTLRSLCTRLSPLRPDYVFDMAPDRTEGQAARDRIFFSRIIGAANYRFGTPVLPERLASGALPRIMPEWERLLQIGQETPGAGPAAACPEFRLPLPGASVREAQELLADCRLPDASRIVGIGPGSKMPAKRWPRENFAALGQRLLDKNPELQLLILGGAEDREMGEALCRQWGERTHNLAGRLSIYGSAAVLEKCACYVGNDTGTMHLAGMSGTPCVAIFSARDYPGKWEPYGSGHVILRADVSCDGCMSETCLYDNKCLRLISVDQVATAAERILSR